MGTSVRLDLPIPSLIKRTGRCEASGTNGAAIHCVNKGPGAFSVLRPREARPGVLTSSPLVITLDMRTYTLLIASHPLRLLVVRWNCPPLRVHPAG